MIVANYCLKLFALDQRFLSIWKMFAIAAIDFGPGSGVLTGIIGKPDIEGTYSY
jgi:hypothetical protein